MFRGDKIRIYFYFVFLFAFVFIGAYYLSASKNISFSPSSGTGEGNVCPDGSAPALAPCISLGDDGIVTYTHDLCRVCGSVMGGAVGPQPGDNRGPGFRCQQRPGDPIVHESCASGNCACTNGPSTPTSTMVCCPAGVGSSCDSGEVCWSGSCVNNECAGTTEPNQLPANAFCRVNEQCQSSVCTTYGYCAA